MSFGARGRRNCVQRRVTKTTVVLVRQDEELARWPLALGGRPCLSDVDDLARLQLTARRLGCSIRLHGVGRDLWQLLDLSGLAQVVATGDGADGLVVEVRGEPKGGEQVGIEEGVIPGDPLA
jgi:hypothetical protein